jgi:AraC family transcriptional regulator
LTTAECDLYGGHVDSLLLSQSHSALIAHLLRCHPLPGATGVRQNSKAIAPRRLRAVLDYIHANLFDAISLKELAAVACLSEFHFASCLKDAMGSSPYRYVLDRRIATATTMLANRDLLLTVITQAVGFARARHFSTSFKAMLSSPFLSIDGIAPIVRLTMLNIQFPSRVCRDPTAFVK